VEHTGRHYVSLYPVIAVVLAAPVYLLSALGPLSVEHHLFKVLEKAAAAAIVALSAVFLYLALRRRTTETMAVGLTLLYAFGTSSLSVSSQGLWQHGPNQPALAAALYAVVRGLTDGRWVGLLGFCLAFAVVGRPTDVLVAGPLGLYILWQQPRAAPWLILGGLPPLRFQLSHSWI
jgi:Dolichyl-phosphate-mannose-protein mannosyltransferase